MKWLKKLKIGAKIGLGFIVLLLFMALIGYIGFRSVNSVQHELNDIFETRLPSIDYLIQADRDLQQLLVAERSMIFANAKSDVFQELVKAYEENLQQADQRWEKYTRLSITPKEQEIVPQYEAARNEWKEISRQIVEGRAADTREGRRAALDLTLGQAKEKFDEMRGYLDKLTGIVLEFAGEAHHRAEDVHRLTLYVLSGFVGFGLLVGLVLMWLMNRAVTRPLKAVIDGLTEASDQVASASGEVSSSSQQLAEGSSEQAASLEETSSSLEEMSSMTRQNASNAEQADSLMKQANKVVEEANTSMSKLTVSMREISSASDETSKIIKTIDEIAFQTNLLALNAAVEAARAGEAGAGFAVVAGEVRNLAMRAAEAAKNTASLIEATVRKVGDGSELVTKTNEAFSEVASNTAKVGELVAEIAAASNEQAQGIDQVAKAVTEMDRVTQRNAANAEESASASEEMSAQAEQMKGFVRNLEALVGASRGKELIHNRRETVRQGTEMIALNASAGKGRPTPTASRNQQHLKHREKKEVSPEEVIPLDKESFDDF